MPVFNIKPILPKPEKTIIIPSLATPKVKPKPSKDFIAINKELIANKSFSRFTRTDSLSKPKVIPEQQLPNIEGKIKRNKKYEPRISHSEWLELRSQPKIRIPNYSKLKRGKSQSIHKFASRLSILSQPKHQSSKFSMSILN